MGGSSWGASEELWAATADQALSDGFQVGISVYGWPSSPPTLQRLERKSARIWRRPRGGSSRLARLTRRLRSPYAHIRHFRPDVILISQSATYDTLYLPDLAAVLAELGRPFVLLCHANDEIVDPRVRAEAPAFFQRADRVGFFSMQSREICQRQIASLLPNALVLQNPVQVVDRAAVPWPSSEVLRLASVGRLDVATKGQDVLFEALAKLGPTDPNWQLTLYGDGVDRAYLERLAGFYGISERVAFAGFVRDIRAVWAENHLLVVSSRGETGPMVVIEAMLCGRPVVATNVGIVPERVKEGVTGFVAEASTPTALVAAIERAWKARADWEKMGMIAHRQATAALRQSPASDLLAVLTDAAEGRRVSG